MPPSAAPAPLPPPRRTAYAERMAFQRLRRPCDRRQMACLYLVRRRVSDADPRRTPRTISTLRIASSITDANNTIKAIAHAVKQANLNIDPETFIRSGRASTSQQMKGVREQQGLHGRADRDGQTDPAEGR